MNPQEIKSIHMAAGQIESALKRLEDLLEETNNQLIYKTSGSLIQALRLLYEFDPELLTPDTRARMEALALADKPKSGRNTFNTGF